MPGQTDKNKIYFHDGENGRILEQRSADGEETGIVEAYLTQWDTVDSWNTSFTKGAFKKTFSTRGAKGTRLIWNHSQLAGKILELREDDYGPYAKVQFNLDTNAGREAYAHVRASDVNCFSFGFNTIKDKWVGQVRQIQEVDMRECGPVVFEANNKAKIVEIRSDGLEPEIKDIFTTAIERISGQVKEERATDFDETQKARELNNRGWSLLTSLEWTIDDIFYQSGNPTPTDIISQVDTAIAKFHTAYIGWLNEYYAQFESRSGKPPCEHRNSLQTAVNSLDMVDLVQRTSLTKAEVETLAKGKLLPLEVRSKIKEAGESVFKAFAETRSQYIEDLCNELRGSKLDKGEVERVEALLASSRVNTETEMVLGVIRDFRAKF